MMGQLKWISINGQLVCYFVSGPPRPNSVR
jgi:hypothetical protein